MASSVELLPPQLGAVLQGTEYRIHRFLGAGGTAEVYEATSPSRGRCALKLMSPRYTAQSPLGSRLRREARVLSDLRHANVVEVLDFGTACGRFYLAMPLLRGATLRDRVAREAATWREAVAITAAALDGLAAGHEAGIIHRDIKPENIFLCVDGTIKVIDFGIAKVENASVATEPGLVFGTPAYMSPEQVVGDAVDPRSDVYSVGVVLYELLAGRRPFNAADPGTVAAMRVRRAAPDVALFAQGAPSALLAAVDKALRANANLRFQTAAEFSSALRECLALDPLVAPEVPLPRAILEVSRTAQTRTSPFRPVSSTPPPPTQPPPPRDRAEDDKRRPSSPPESDSPEALSTAIQRRKERHAYAGVMGTTRHVSLNEVHLRGTAVAPAPVFVKRHFGEGGWASFLGALDAEARAVIEQPIIAMSWYPYRHCLAYIDAIMTLAVGRKSVLREFAIENLDYATNVVFRAIFKVGTPEFMVARSDQVWKKLYSHGRMVCDVGPGRARIELHEFPFLTANSSRVVMHSIEAVLLKAGAQVKRAEQTKVHWGTDGFSEFVYEWS